MKVLDGLRINEKNQVVLCGDKICCPVMEKLSDGRYRIIDDDGSSIIVSAEQAQLIAKGVQQCNEMAIKEETLICG